MTTRNLNTTWKDIVFKQYAADFEADVPFPVRYLINIPVVYGLPGRDIWIDIPTKIDLKTLKNAIVAFNNQKPPFKMMPMTMRQVLGLVLAVAPLATRAWDFVIYADSECESTSPAPDHKSGTGNVDCSENTASHRSFEISNMGNCILWLYSDVETCENDDTDFEQQYDFGEENQCIPPDFNWNGYKVDSC